MAKQEHLDRLKQGVKRWNQWRQEHWDVQADLSGADLRKADLSGADLSGAFLNEAFLREANLNRANLNRAFSSGANLSGVNLREANFSRADLSGTNLSMVNLREANLNEADLSGANLRKAFLNGANLNRVEFREVDLSEVHLGGTVFAGNDLRTAKGLVEIDHQGPSRVELHTVKLPQDGSALHFLRGVGIPNEWIDFYRSSMMTPIQYHSCFISYAHHDEMLARRLHADLQDHGVRCWFAPEDMKIGDKIRARIDEAIHLQDKLLLLLSKSALASGWVEDEVEAALEKEQRQQREVLFPVRLDEQVMQTNVAWAAKLRRTRHIGDFTHWTDPQEYQRAFERLLRDLKAEAKKTEEP